ncbi:unnamed protein product [Moneuplotes crassus]|uniref:t-SNARE coiled-coil homology domain-containing protein n=2 Tax=Euplotes crassus TaxID=5936 RepID=A0AAD1XVG6_EUPCR|nr:unnamed protein product [Moneuplotes crassus]
MEYEDIQEDIEANKEEIENQLDSYSDLAGADQKAALAKINKLIKEMESNTKDFRQSYLGADIPIVKEAELKDNYQSYVDLAKEYKERVQRLNMVVDSQSEEKDEESLVFKNGKIDYNKNTTEQVVKHGLDTQDKSKKVAERLEGRVHEMNDMADDQLEELDRQEEVILKINEANMEIESDMKRAQKYIKYFARTYMQDKCIIVLIFLCCVAILGVFIVALIDDK